ncbi:MAG: hypothetical protein OHK0022_28120 [Roseiflexaceae bacterium]
MSRLKVKEVAEARGWNASRLARRADISNTAMYGIWHGTTEDPGLKTLEAIARALGVKISELIDESDLGESGAGFSDSSDDIRTPGAFAAQRAA